MKRFVNFQILTKMLKMLGQIFNLKIKFQDILKLLNW